jgi:hypothetical protein
LAGKVSDRVRVRLSEKNPRERKASAKKTGAMTA